MLLDHKTDDCMGSEKNDVKLMTLLPYCKTQKVVKKLTLKKSYIVLMLTACTHVINRG
jgi:hypothetical protein